MYSSEDGADIHSMLLCTDLLIKGGFTHFVNVSHFRP